MFLLYISNLVLESPFLLDLEHDEIDDWIFNEKASLKSVKMVLRLGISKFSLFIPYVVGYFYTLKP